jgi:uncharacterized protein YlzI (FlbEa/FlbD family)
MKTWFFLFLFASMSCLKSNSSETRIVETYTPKETKSKTIRHFQHALTYRVIKNGESFELWFYINEKKGEVLYVPNDDMLQAVISKPDGTYTIYGIDENGKKVFWTEKVNEVQEKVHEFTALQPLQVSRKIDQRNIQQPDIHCEGFEYNDTTTKGSQILFATTDIPMNSYQIYGFCLLTGDAKLPVQMDFIQRLHKNQLITHLEDAYQKIELLNYGPNPYEFDTKGYLKLKQ